jgi:hypothetical protein
VLPRVETKKVVMESLSTLKAGRLFRDRAFGSIASFLAIVTGDRYGWHEFRWYAAGDGEFEIMDPDVRTSKHIGECGRYAEGGKKHASPGLIETDCHGLNTAA